MFRIIDGWHASCNRIIVRAEVRRSLPGVTTEEFEGGQRTTENRLTS